MEKAHVGHPVDFMLLPARHAQNPLTAEHAMGTLIDRRLCNMMSCTEH